MSNILSFDLNPYCFRGVLVDDFGSVLNHVDTKTSLTFRRWLKRVLAEEPGASIIASPLDEATDAITAELSAAGRQTQWLNPAMCRQLHNVGRPYSIQRKLHRARLVAFLHRHQATPWDLKDWVREYENGLARETLNMEG